MGQFVVQPPPATLVMAVAGHFSLELHEAEQEEGK